MELLIKGLLLSLELAVLRTARHAKNVEVWDLPNLILQKQSFFILLKQS
jgi:hypothetical protein